MSALTASAASGRSAANACLNASSPGAFAASTPTRWTLRQPADPSGQPSRPIWPPSERYPIANGRSITAGTHEAHVGVLHLDEPRLEPRELTDLRPHPVAGDDEIGLELDPPPGALADHADDPVAVAQKVDHLLLVGHRQVAAQRLDELADLDADRHRRAVRPGRDIPARVAHLLEHADVLQHRVALVPEHEAPRLVPPRGGPLEHDRLDSAAMEHLREREAHDAASDDHHPNHRADATGGRAAPGSRGVARAGPDRVGSAPRRGTRRAPGRYAPDETDSEDRNVATSPLHRLSALGQSVWVDNLSRNLLEQRRARSDDPRRCRRGRHLEPHHLPEGPRRRRRVRRSASRRAPPSRRTPRRSSWRSPHRTSPTRATCSTPSGRPPEAATAMCRWRWTRGSPSTSRRPSTRRCAFTPRSTSRTSW